MNLLAPLYALGALAVAAPLLFHLIRRTPRGEVAFSSLMFLAPAPPRLTRRSRLEHVFLLLLRAAALVLLAAAFARPYLRGAARADPGESAPRRVALLIDTSASLRRGDLWGRARDQADAVIADCRPGDHLAVFAFDASTTPVLGFAESRSLDPSRRQAIARARLAALSPGWGPTDLGRALADAAAALDDAADARGPAGRAARRVVLVSDLQQGSRLDALREFEWPSDVELDLKAVTDPRANAGLQWLAEVAPAEAPAGTVPAPTPPGLRVRVTNDAGSRRESFGLTWVDGAGRASGPRVPVYVPPGEGRVARVAMPTGPVPEGGQALRLRLDGDEQPFDNTLYLAPEPREEATVLYVGPDAENDPSGLLYYLERALPDTPRRGVRVVRASPGSSLVGEPGRSTALVVLAAETTPANAARLGEDLKGGRTVLAVLAAPGRLATLAALAGVPPFEAGDADGGRDRLLTDIAFDHPLFAPLAGPQFNDFTRVRFWKHRRVDPEALGGRRVLARFDDGDAAVLEKPVGKGRLVVFTSGWGPADSQLARSSKFVPLVAGLLGGHGARPDGPPDHRVFERVDLPAASPGGPGLVVVKPDGTTVRPPPGATSFGETDQPGVYTVRGGPATRRFAVNLDPSESRTSPLTADTFEQYGCRLAAGPARKAAERERFRQLQTEELEGRQKLWRPLVVAAVCVLVVETLLAARLGRARPARTREEAPAS